MGDIVFCSFYLLLFSFIILKARLFKLPGLSTAWSVTAFGLKLLFAFLLWYIYTHHYKNRYTSDIFKYFDDGKFMYQTVHTNISDFLAMMTGIGDWGSKIQGYYHSMASWVNGHDSTLYNNSHFIIRFNALLMFISCGHYGVHVLVMCFISFTGLTYLYKAFYPYLQDKAKLLYAAIFLFPSVLLWSSGILKEGFVFLGLGLSIYYFKKLLGDGTQMTQKDMINDDKTNVNTENTQVIKKSAIIIRNPRHLRSIVFMLIGFILLFEAKAYILLCIIPGFISEMFISKVKAAAKHPFVTYIMVTAIYLLVGLNINTIYPSLNPIRTLSDKQKEFIRLTKGGIYLAEASNDTLYAYIPVEDSVDIIPANAYADSLRKKGIQYLSTAAFCYQEETTKKIAPFRLKTGLKFDLIHEGHNDTLHLIANDSMLYRIDTYIEPAKSAIAIPPFNPTLSGLIAAVPNALVISLIRPFPKEISSAAILIYFGENVFILLLIILALVFYKKNNPNNNMIAFCVNYCLLVLVLIGISTPLYGGIERYKSVVIPFILILLLLIYDKDKYKKTEKS